MQWTASVCTSKPIILMNAEPWISLEDVASHLDVSKDSVHRWIRNRGMPAHKIGRLWKFKVSEVDEWVRNGGGDVEEGTPGTEA